MREERAPRPGQLAPWWVVFGACGFIAVLLAATLWLGGSSLPVAVQVVLVVLTFLPWIPVERQKLVSAEFVVASLVPTLILTWTGASPLLFGVLALSAARTGMFSRVPMTAAYALAAIGIVVGREFVAGQDTDWWMWQTYVELGALVGIALHYQRQLMIQTKAASKEHARLAALEERRRIARDVHDVLAHTLTILMVHVNSARLQVRDDPEATAEILDDVAAYGRRGLADIRRAVGLLSENPSARSGSGGATYELGELVESYRKAGIDIDLAVDLAGATATSLHAITNASWNATYRIVQESVANAAKHAGGEAIRVRIAIDDDGIHVECRNKCGGARVLELPNGGNGIEGMRERAESVGGAFRAGMEGDEWVVRADLPTGNDDGTPNVERLGRVS